MRPEGTILFISDPYLYAVSADGEVLRQLSYVHTELSARWSPNGQKILFVSQHEGNPEIYVMNADGTELINLTHSSRDELSARWFPDGGKVLFFQQSDSSEFIYVVDVDGTNQTVLAEYQEIGTYDLSPSGQWLVFGGESEDKSDLFLVSVNNAKTKQLTHNTLSDRPVKWSPDGRKILFVSEHDGNRELYVMDADGAHQTRLTYTEDADESMPSWSPDGRYIAYEEHHSSDFNPLYIVSPGSVPTKVGDEGLFNDVWSYAWSPDSQYLAISGIHAWEGYHIYIVDIACATSLDGCGREDANNILLHHPPFHNVPRGLSWSPITRK
jgi:Tol biopolymer transport system component